MLSSLLLVLNILVCIALIGVVLLQRSEGGVLGGGGSPTGLISTRGAGDLLTRTTWVLFSTFLVISLALTLLGGRERSSQAVLERLKNQRINPASLLAAKPPGAVQGAASTATSAPPPIVTVPPAGAPARAPVSGFSPFAAPTPSVNLAPLPSNKAARTPAP